MELKLTNREKEILIKCVANRKLNLKDVSGFYKHSQSVQGTINRFLSFNLIQRGEANNFIIDIEKIKTILKENDG